MSNVKRNFDMANLAAALNAEDQAGLLDAIKNNVFHVTEEDFDFIGSLKPEVRKRVHVLRNLQKEHDEIEAIFFEERAALEAKYQKLYQPFYAKRYEIVNGLTDVEGDVVPVEKEGENAASEKGVPNFWFLALRNNEVLTDAITERDEGALKYLKDIKWCKMDEPKGFKLEFVFDTNPYFKNTVLTKVYHMVDEDEPMLEKATGTEIEWYPGKCLTEKLLKKKPKKAAKNGKPDTKTEDCESFFNFFYPPEVPEPEQILDDETAAKLQNEMENDYDIGSTIRDKIIPHAVSWYTGEATEGDDFNDDLDEDEDYFDDDEDEETEEEEDLKVENVANKKMEEENAQGGVGEKARPAEFKQQ